MVVLAVMRETEAWGMGVQGEYSRAIHGYVPELRYPTQNYVQWK